MKKTVPTLPTSRHFRLKQLAEGVYAAFALDGGAAYCNGGIVDLGDMTLIYDSFMTPRAAQDLRAAAETLTGRPAAFVVNSHAHGDHWWGNQVFLPEATIIATYATRQLLAASDMIEQLQADPSPLESAIRENEELLQSESDERKRASLEARIAMDRCTLEALPTLTPQLPQLTFADKVVFHGEQRTARLLSPEGGGHLAGDAILVLPAEGIAFLGDLGFFQGQPYMADPKGDLQAWVRILEKLEASDLDTFVPGHGPLGTKQDLALIRLYIITLEQLAQQVVAGGGSADDAAQLPLPAPFDTWKDPWGAWAFDLNMRFLHERLSAGESTGKPDTEN
jgi:glyoxylase-like metal-dependent hydrolase (beta-lactamase superfamily II)